MDNLEAFQTLLEIILLILSLASQSPILGIIAAMGIFILILTNQDVNNE